MKNHFLSIFKFISFIFLAGFYLKSPLAMSETLNPKQEYHELQTRLQSAKKPADIESLIGVHEARCVTLNSHGYQNVPTLLLFGKMNVAQQGRELVGVNLILLPSDVSRLSNEGRRFRRSAGAEFYFFGQYAPATLDFLGKTQIWDYIQGFFSGRFNNKNYQAAARTGFENESYVSKLGYESQNLRHFLTNSVTIRQDQAGYLFVGQESNYSENDIPGVLFFYCGQIRRVLGSQHVPQAYR